MKSVNVVQDKHHWYIQSFNDWVNMNDSRDFMLAEAMVIDQVIQPRQNVSFTISSNIREQILTR